MTQETADTAKHLLRSGNVAGLVLLPDQAYNCLGWEDLAAYIYWAVETFGQVNIGYQHNRNYGHIFAPVGEETKLYRALPSGVLIPRWAVNNPSIIDELFTITREQLDRA